MATLPLLEQTALKSIPLCSSHQLYGTVGGKFCLYFVRRENHPDPVFDRMLQEFMDGTDEEEKKKVKMIPSVKRTLDSSQVHRSKAESASEKQDEGHQGQE